MNRNILIIIGVLILVGLGILFVTSMTGNVITGLAVAGGEEVGMENEYFKISDFGAEELNGGDVEDGEGRRG